MLSDGIADEHCEVEAEKTNAESEGAPVNIRGRS